MAPKILLLPSSSPSTTSPTFITLPHPRTSTPTRCLLHPTLGLQSLTTLPPTSSKPQSWLLTPSLSSTPNQSTWLVNGQTISTSSLHLSTPVDPLFHLLPILLPADTTPSDRFLPLDDLLDTVLATADRQNAHYTALLLPGSASRKQVEKRIRSVSEKAEIGDGEYAYKVVEEKVIKSLEGKVERMAKQLPKSLEEEFVVKPLVGVLGSTTLAVGNAAPLEEEGKIDEKEIEGEKEEEVVQPTPPPPPPPVDTNTPLHALLRIRVALQYLSLTLLPLHIATKLSERVSKTHDFTPLDTHLAELKKARAEAALARQGDFVQKRGRDEEDDDRAEKKRKKEEEEKKKKKMVSQGVKNLSKVNTRGMAKMTSFFKKVENK